MTLAPHRDTVERFVDCMHAGADNDALAEILAEDVVLFSPLGDEPVTGRGAVVEAMQGVGAVAADLTYQEILSGETHHAAYFRLQIEDTAVDGMDYILVDADGKIAEVTIWWRPLPSGVQMQRQLAESTRHAALGTSRRTRGPISPPVNGRLSPLYKSPIAPLSK